MENEGISTLGATVIVLSWIFGSTKIFYKGKRIRWYNVWLLPTVKGNNMNKDDLGTLFLGWFLGFASFLPIISTMLWLRKYIELNW